MNRLSDQEIDKIVEQRLAEEKAKKLKKKLQKKANNIVLPRKLIVIKNEDKKWHEHWTKDRDPLDFPWPSRFLLVGRPNSGKSTVIKNIILRANPPYEKIIVCHCDKGGTHEYDDLDVEIRDTIPNPDEFENSDFTKTLLIIDDLELKNLPKSQRIALDRTFGYTSTHKGLSVMMTSQDMFNVPPAVRRCTNVFILWKVRDMDSLNCIARKVGYSARDFRELFSLCTAFHDSIWIDTTAHSPHPLRKNGFEMIEENSI